MAETISNAQLRYLPGEGVFEAEICDLSETAAAGADELETSRLASRWACVEALAELPGVHATGDPDVTVIWAEAKELFAEKTPTATLTRFLAHLNTVLPAYPSDGVDYVVGLEAVWDRGAAVSVYDQYQRWLENGHVGDEVLRRALAAAVLPLNPGTSAAELSKTFWYQTDGETERASIGSGSQRTILSVVRGEFNDVQYKYTSDPVDPPGSWRQTMDVYLLRQIGMQRVTGDTFGVLDSARNKFVPDGTRLYEMRSGTGCIPHPRELGGYLLAMGVLADEASRFSGGRPVTDMAMQTIA